MIHSIHDSIHGYLELYSAQFDEDKNTKFTTFLTSQWFSCNQKNSGYEGRGSNPSGIRAIGCFRRGDRAPVITFGLFPLGRVGGRRDFVVENRVGVGGRPDTSGPVGGPASCTEA